MAYDVQYAPEKPDILKGIIFIAVVAAGISFFISKQFMKDANRNLTEQYPTAEIVQTEKEGFIIPKRIQFTCRDTEYDMLFIQSYNRKGTHAVEADDGAYSYQTRAKTHTDCLTQIAALQMPKDVPYHIVRYPNDTGFTVFTKATAPDEVDALVAAMQPETVKTSMPFCIDICSPELYHSCTHTDFSAMYQSAVFALFAHEEQSRIILTKVFPIGRITSDVTDIYSPDDLSAYTQVLDVDPQNSMIELSGILGEDKVHISHLLHENPGY